VCVTSHANARLLVVDRVRCNPRQRSDVKSDEPVDETADPDRNEECEIFDTRSDFLDFCKVRAACVCVRGCVSEWVCVRLGVDVCVSWPAF
jgi:hypothetical protein